MEFLRKKDNVMNLFLGGSFAVLTWRAYRQQQEIDALLVEKSVLQRGNKAMTSSMWAWRDHLFHLAEADPSSAPISSERIRAIYGEENRATDVPASPLDDDFVRGPSKDAPRDETIIA